MEKAEYSKLKYSVRYNSDAAQSILASFMERYVDLEKLNRYILMWNSFSDKPKCLSVMAIPNIAVPSEKSVLFYNERELILYGTTMKDVVCFVNNLEPWNQVDACITFLSPWRGTNLRLHRYEQVECFFP